MTVEAIEADKPCEDPDCAGFEHPEDLHYHARVIDTVWLDNTGALNRSSFNPDVLNLTKK